MLVYFAKGESKSTPAKPSERIFGSKINKPNTADSGYGIKLKKSTTDNLRQKLKDVNKGRKGKKLSLSKLKASYRRGLGAYSTSHRPNVMSRDQWAMGRVNALLRAYKTGSFRSRKFDTDLLPKRKKGYRSRNVE
jgi:hypothetical protein